MLVHFLLCVPCTNANALMVPNDHDGEIKVHIDSSVSEQFISYVRLLASWNEDMSNVMFNTATCTLITSRDVSILTFMAFDGHGNQRVVTYEQA